MGYTDLLRMMDPEAADILESRNPTIGNVAKVITMDQGKTEDGRRRLMVYGMIIVDEETPGVAEAVAKIEIQRDTMKDRPDLYGMGLGGIATNEPWQST